MKALLLLTALVAGSCHASPAEMAEREAGWWAAADHHARHLARPTVFGPVRCDIWNGDFRIGCESFVRDLEKLPGEDGEGGQK